MRIRIALAAAMAAIFFYALFSLYPTAAQAAVRSEPISTDMSWSGGARHHEITVAPLDVAVAAQRLADSPLAGAWSQRASRSRSDRVVIVRNRVVVVVPRPHRRMVELSEHATRNAATRSTARTVSRIFKIEEAEAPSNALATGHRAPTPAAPPTPATPPTPPAVIVAPTDATSTNTTDWQCIRVHESGDEYNNPAEPSGAYGILETTWLSNGYSGWPYQASATVQDALALQLYNEFGWTPWSTRFVCGLG